MKTTVINLPATSQGTQKITVDPLSGLLDSFGRLRVSNISNIFESTHSNSDQSEFWDTELTGGGTSTHVPATASVNLAVGTASGDKVTRRTMEYFHYSSGQSMVIRLTGVLSAGETNCKISLGYFNDDNGLIFQNIDGVANLTIRSDVSGSVVDRSFPQSEWNLDTGDGSGGPRNPSGLLIDPTKTHIFQVEYQWLGVGMVRFGIHSGGKVIYLHEVEHANVETEVYMRTPHQPVTYEIENTGITTGSNTLMQICTQVGNEGSALVGDLIRSVDREISTVTVNTTADTPIISQRLAPGNEGVSIEFVSFDLFVTSNDDVLFKLYIDGVLTSPVWGLGSDEGGFTQKDIVATAISGGRKMGSVWINKNGKTDPGQFKSKYRLGFYIDGTPNHITVTGRARSGSAAVSAIILYKELF